MRHAHLCCLRALVALLACLPVAGATAAHAQPSAALPDTVQLLSLTAEVAAPPQPESPIQFHATVGYQLSSAQSGFLLLFLFEDDVASATQQGAQGHTVKAGSGRVAIDATYQPPAGVSTISVLVGLFKDQDTLLGWSSTQPVSLAPWPGRAAFASALAARDAGDYARAVTQLSTAIAAAPNNAAYYYWRADGELRLGRYSDALRDYTRSLDLQPQDRASRAGRGIALLWMNDWPAALDELNAVLGQGDPADGVAAWARRARGVAYAALGRSEAAVDDLQRYLDLVPAALDRADVEKWIADLRATGMATTVPLPMPLDGQ